MSEVGSPLLGQKPPSSTPSSPQSNPHHDAQSHSSDSDAIQENQENFSQPAQRFTVISVLLLGVFIANVDGTLVIAQTAPIASEFNNLASSEWLVTIYFLASCAIQPLLGKLSDIYGRKSMLMWCYVIFICGNFLSGAGFELWQLLVGRAFAGAGGAGMSSLVSIVIADLVPIRTVAAWRSYSNVAATTGRSIGGPLGGLMSDTIGWRWSFYIQCPLTLVAFLLVLLKLPGRAQERNPKSNGDLKESQFDKLRRIDFLGAATIITATVSFLLALELGGKRMAWASPTTTVLFVSSCLFGVGFLLVEKYWAKEAIFPIRLFIHRDVITSYPIGLLQAMAQMGLMYSIPLYFQIAVGASNLDAGARLVPAVVGNAAAGLLCGYVIKRSGRYWLLTIESLLFACLGYGLIITRWHGSTNWAETLYIFPGGFGTGAVFSTTFIALTAGVEESDFAVAASGFYQAIGLGGSIGTVATMTILQASLRPMLDHALRSIGNKDQIIQRSIADVVFVRSLEEPIREIVTKCYVRGLMFTHIASLSFSALALLVAFCVKEHTL